MGEEGKEGRSGAMGRSLSLPERPPEGLGWNTGPDQGEGRSCRRPSPIQQRVGFIDHDHQGQSLILKSQRGGISGGCHPLSKFLTPRYSFRRLMAACFLGWLDSA